MFERPFANPRLESSQHSFSMVPRAQIPRSSFNRSHGYKTTMDSGYLVPVFVDEALPGDTFNLRMTSFARLATPIVPIMDNMYCDAFFFAVPYRLVWDNWEKFNGAQDNPGDSISFQIPQMVSPAGGYAVGSLQDYFGLPTVGQVVGGDTVSHMSLPLRCYNLIWNEWFRDQNLQNSLTVDKGDGPDVYTNYVLKRRGKRHDYFTSCLPWPQKGTAVSMPLGSTAPLISDGQEISLIGQTSGAVGYLTPSASGGVASMNMTVQSGATVNGETLYYHNKGLLADLSSATAATINSLRQAFQIQKLLERDARGGTRYTEVIRAHFGVISPDFRLQRPEFLGGGSTPITVSPIPQTSATGATGSPQGNLAAIGTFSHGRVGFTKSFTEHCIVVGLVSVRADLNYQQGLNRMWSRLTRYDFYWPALAHIGEQAVLNKEIYCDGSANDSGVFGYQERYAEYRYKPSTITGQFRSTYSAPLDYWHLAQKFTSLPVLGDTFIQDTPPVSRVVAVTTAPQFLFDAVFDFKCARPMPVYSVPGLIDHF